MILLLSLIVTVLPVQAAPAGQVPEAKSSPFVLRIRTAGCPHEPRNYQQTGFIVKGLPGVVTALHGVAGCSSITAATDDFNDNDMVGLEIYMVDIERDVAILTPGGLRVSANAKGFTVATVSSSSYRKLQVIGYPAGVTVQDRIPDAQVLERKNLAALVPPRYQTPLKARSSPALEISVLNVKSAQLVPGHSGGPIITDKGEIVGVANGGLLSGTVEIGWAIPWEDIKWMAKDKVKSRMDLLLENDPQLALGFSSTYPDYETEEIELNPIAARTFKSFRSRMVMRQTGRSGYAVIETGQADSGRKRIMDITTNLPVFGPDTPLFGSSGGAVKISAYAVGQDHYGYLQGSQPVCVILDTPTAAGLQGVHEQLMMLVSSQTADNEPFLGALIGEEVINGERTYHYLINAAASPPPDGQTPQITGGEMWITVRGGYMLRAVVEAIYPSIPGQPFEGPVTLSIDFFDIDKTIRIDLPSACRNATVLSNNTAPDSSSESSAPASGSVKANIFNVAVEFDVMFNGVKGMVVYPSFSISGALRRSMTAVAYVLDANGRPLPAKTNAYMAVDGTFAAWRDFVPAYNPARYDSYGVFIPYDELNVAPGKHNLQYRVDLYDYATGRPVAASKAYAFTFTLSAPSVNNAQMEAEVLQHLAGAPQAEINAYVNADASYAAGYYAKAVLQDIDDSIRGWADQGLYAVPYYDAASSYVAEVRVKDANTAEADACEYWLMELYNLQDGSLYQRGSWTLNPQTITLQRINGSWFITAIQFYENAAFCN